MFKKVLMSLSLIIGFLTLQSYGNPMNIVEYKLIPNKITSYLDNENQSSQSYVIKYSFFELTTDKVYYIYDKKDTSHALFKFVTSTLGNSILYKSIEGQKYEKALSIKALKGNNQEYYNHSNAYDVLDENNTV